MPGGDDTRIELAGSAPAELVHASAIVAIDDEHAGDPVVVAAAKRLATLLGARIVGGPGAMRAGVIAAGAVVDRSTALAPEVCVAIGTPAIDLAGATSFIRIGAPGGKTADGAITGLAGPALTELVRALEEAP